MLKLPHPKDWIMSCIHVVQGSCLHLMQVSVGCRVPAETVLEGEYYGIYAVEPCGG